MIPACLSDDWTLCPEREDISAEFTRLLTAAQEGGATIAECLMIARQLKRGDDRISVDMTTTHEDFEAVPEDERFDLRPVSELDDDEVDPC